MGWRVRILLTIAAVCLVCSPSSAITFSNQVVTSAAPPATGCVRPASITSFVPTNQTVYLYFEAVVAQTDNLVADWVAPDGTVITGFSWPPNPAGNYCFPNSSLSIANTTKLGSWVARVRDNGTVLFTVPFTVIQTVAAQNYTVYTVAGGGLPNQVLATSVGVQSATSVAKDAAGNVYVGFQSGVYKVDAAGVLSL